MPSLGDLERFAATGLYPLRFVIAALAIAALTGLVVAARRRGWLAAARRHPGRTATLLALTLLVVAPAAWYLGSPLFTRTELNEPPLTGSVGAKGSTSPVATQAQPEPSDAAASPGATATQLAPTSGPPSPAGSPKPASRVRSGLFASADDFHFGRGRATLVEAPDGRLTLRFDDFSVRNGPDLYVYLSPDAADFAEGAVELGRLRATDGSFNTPIPDGVDVAGVRSVVIWCKEFAVLFAVAPLGG